MVAVAFVAAVVRGPSLNTHVIIVGVVALLAKVEATFVVLVYMLAPAMG